ncbi:MAG: hypothetical protein QXP66_00975 [Candidatus Aenigmatarchaeota archaeon]
MLYGLLLLKLAQQLSSPPSAMELRYGGYFKKPVTSETPLRGIINKGAIMRGTRGKLLGTIGKLTGRFFGPAGAVTGIAGGLLRKSPRQFALPLTYASQTAKSIAGNGMPGTTSQTKLVSPLIKRLAPWVGIGAGGYLAYRALSRRREDPYKQYYRMGKLV